MNKVFLKGRLTADPEIKQTTNGLAVVRFTVAVDRRFEKGKTDFIVCEAWRQTAEFVSKYFKKGKEILLIGELHLDKVEKDGKTNIYTKVSVDEVYFCGSKADGDTAPNPYLNMTPVEPADDLPF